MRILITTDGSTSSQDVQMIFQRGDNESCVEIDLTDQPELSSTILDALGLALLHRGLVDTGRPLIESGLRIRREFFGEDHPATALSQNSYARVERQSGEYTDAETEVRKALAINSRTYGGNSLPVALNLNELAVIQLQLSQFTAAEQSAQSGLNILEALHLECTDPNVTRLMDTLGRVHQVRGNYERASEIYLKLLDTDRRQVGERHLKYATHLLNFGTVQAAQGKLDQAKHTFAASLEIMRSDPARPRHPNIIDALANLGSVLRAMGDFNAARNVLHEALEMDIEVRGKNHPYIGNDHARLGRLAYDLRDFEAAAAAFRAALEIYEYNVGLGQLPKNHAFIAEARAWLARTLVEHGKSTAEDARGHALAALSVLELEFGERSVEYAITNAVLGRSLYLLNRSSAEARERLNKAYPVVMAARGADSAVAKLIQGWLREADGTGAQCT
jgi:tetratricopeptide (TPR) repeat protein